ncbi:ORF6N domain-containing protein [Candidatus Woesearchaeota archaeon]|nr:ORF6N domain-containing protein [Candidatus Woesearchaeota archaeon]
MTHINNSQNENSIENKIYTIRGLKVMLDSDLAYLYEVETKQMNRAVRRNIERFPEDFMFQLTEEEFLRLQYITSKENSLELENETLNKNSIRCQNDTLNKNSPRLENETSKNKRGKHRKYLPYVFTEQGVATLSGILKSKKAIEMNILIMRTFVSIRKFISQNARLFNEFDKIDKKLLEHDKKFDKVFEAIEDKLPKTQGIFFNGQMFEARNFVCDLIRSAKKRIILIDNYINDSVLDLFSERNSNVEVIIYTKEISKKLLKDLELFNSNLPPIKIKEFNKSHDRFLIIDENSYLFGASIKDLGKKWFGFFKIEKDKIKILNQLE